MWSQKQPEKDAAVLFFKAQALLLKALMVVL
jgi:hypothetical protein